MKFLSFQKVRSKKVRNKVNCTREVEKKIGHLEKYAMVRKYAIISLLVNIFQKKNLSFQKGSNASLAAKEIHSDIQRGFIKAEIIKYKELEEYGSERAVKDAGLARLEGRDYIVNDGDCIFFHFNI